MMEIMSGCVCERRVCGIGKCRGKRQGCALEGLSACLGGCAAAAASLCDCDRNTNNVLENGNGVPCETEGTEYRSLCHCLQGVLRQRFARMHCHLKQAARPTTCLYASRYFRAKQSWR
jgi:hypothetical protein